MRRTIAGTAVVAAVLVWSAGLAGAATTTTTVPTINPMTYARGHLGPLGWFWNHIYYLVFNGKVTNMAVFGWVLFIAPLVLVLSMRTVLQGTKGTLRKPYVPDEIRTRVN